jgi:2-keto-4-pentenoate hydratase
MTLLIDQIAETLRSARLNRAPIEAPSAKWPELDVATAIAVQRRNVDHQVASDDRVVGYKLGNIAQAMQSKFGLNQPDYGHLLASTFAYEGGPIARGDFIEPFVELEPAFILGRALRGPNVTVADVIAAVDHVVPAIEIIDSRVVNWDITLPDTLADNGSTGAVIIGGSPRPVANLPLQDMRGSVSHHGVEVASGSTKAILGNPLSAVAFVCNTLAEYGIEFADGDLILAGSCLAAVPMEQEGRWSGHFDGWGSIEFDVTA